LSEVGRCIINISYQKSKIALAASPLMQERNFSLCRSPRPSFFCPSRIFLLPLLSWRNTFPDSSPLFFHSIGADLSSFPISSAENFFANPQGIPLPFPPPPVLVLFSINLEPAMRVHPFPSPSRPPPPPPLSIWSFPKHAYAPFFPQEVPPALSRHGAARPMEKRFGLHLRLGFFFFPFLGTRVCPFTPPVSRPVLATGLVMCIWFSLFFSGEIVALDFPLLPFQNSTLCLFAVPALSFIGCVAGFFHLTHDHPFSQQSRLFSDHRFPFLFKLETNRTFPRVNQIPFAVQKFPRPFWSFFCINPPSSSNAHLLFATPGLLNQHPFSFPASIQHLLFPTASGDFKLFIFYRINSRCLFSPMTSPFGYEKSPRTTWTVFSFPSPLSIVGVKFLLPVAVPNLCTSRATLQISSPPFFPPGGHSVFFSRTRLRSFFGWRTPPPKSSFFRAETIFPHNLQARLSFLLPPSGLGLVEPPFPWSFPGKKNRLPSPLLPSFPITSLSLNTDQVPLFLRRSTDRGTDYKEDLPPLPILQKLPLSGEKYISFSIPFHFSGPLGYSLTMAESPHSFPSRECPFLPRSLDVLFPFDLSFLV